MSSPNKSTTQIQAGVDIPPPSPGKVFPWLSQRFWLTQVVNAAVSWLNVTFIIKLLNADGTSTISSVKPVITAKNSTVTLPIDLTNVSTTPGNSANVPFSGTSDPPGGLPAGNYVTSPIPSLYVNMTDKTLWVCTTSGTESTSGWAQINGVAIYQFKIQSLSAINSYIARTWDGANLGSIDFTINKPTGAQLITGETIDGVVISYTNTDDNNRTASDGTNSEYQVMFPRYVAGQVIVAAQIQNGIWVEIKPARVWARRYTQ